MAPSRPHLRRETRGTGPRSRRHARRRGRSASASCRGSTRTGLSSHGNALRPPPHGCREATSEPRCLLLFAEHTCEDFKPFDACSVKWVWPREEPNPHLVTARHSEAPVGFRRWRFSSAPSEEFRKAPPRDALRGRLLAEASAPRPGESTARWFSSARAGRLADGDHGSFGAGARVHLPQPKIP